MTEYAFFRHAISFFSTSFFFWLCWIFVALHRLSRVVPGGGCSCCCLWTCHCGGFSFGEHGLYVHGLQQLWLVGSREQARWLPCTGLVAPQYMESSQTWGQTFVWQSDLAVRFLTNDPQHKPKKVNFYSKFVECFIIIKYLLLLNTSSMYIGMICVCVWRGHLFFILLI